jgi:hypothetical protein
MRGIGSIISLVIVAAIGMIIYKSYFSQLQATTGADSGSPTRTVDVVGVKNDLLAIAQAERAYQAQHGSVASLDELTSSGAMALAKPGRNGYIYEVESSGNSFHVVAHCPSTANPGCTNYVVDDAMEVQPAP